MLLIAGARGAVHGDACALNPRSREDGFSFASGMLAVKKNGVMRVNVRPRIPTEHGTVNPTLTRELLLAALQTN